MRPPLQVCLDDLAEFWSAHELIPQCQQTANGGMETFAPKGEKVKTKFKAFSVVTLIVSKLHQGDKFLEWVQVFVTLCLCLAVADLGKHLL